MLKNNKGITIIALIITVIVLLILAVVTIGAMEDNHIIFHAGNGAKAYNNSKIAEEKVTNSYEDFIQTNLEDFQSMIGNNGGSTGSSVIVNSTANSIPNGTYYYCGANTENNYLVISDEGNELYWEEQKFEPTISIANGVVTMVINGTIVYQGNYYETINNNKIITLGNGEFGTTRLTKNSRNGFLFAMNTNDLRYDIEGTYVGEKTREIIFTQGSNVAVNTYDGNETGDEYYYAGFENMFYINDKQIRYEGLTEGFAWGESDGATYTKKTN